MTEERIIILGIPDIVKLEGGHRRRNSTGRFEILDGVKVFSRYLKPSISSCHDFCKYGEERALEIKARGPMSISKEITDTLGEGQNLDRSVTSAERKKKWAVSRKHSRDSKSQKFDDPIVNGVVSSLTKEETVLSKLFSSPLKGIDVPMMKSKLSKQYSLPIQGSSHGGDRKNRKIKDMGMFKRDDNIVKGVIPSLTKEETILPKPVSSPLKETDILVKHAGDPKMKPNLSKQYSLPIQRRSNGGGDRKIRKSKDMGMFKLDDTIVEGVVSSLTKEETISSKPVSSPLKEIDASMKRASDPKRKPNLSKQYSLPIQRRSNHGGDRKNRKSKDMGMFKLDDLVEGVVSSLTKEETISSKLVSSPLKEIDASVKRASDPKRKTNLSKQSSLPVQRCSNGEGDRRIRKGRDVGKVPMNSPGTSSSRIKSKSKRIKEMRSSVRRENKVWVPSPPLSAKHPVKVIPSQNVRNSRNLNAVSHMSYQKTVRKPKAKQYRSEDITEKPLHAVEPNAEDKTQRPIKNDVHATGLSPSSSLSPDDKILKGVQNEICTAQLSPLSAKRNLRNSQKRIHASESRRSWPPSPKRKCSRASLLGTRIARSDTSSLASLSTHSGASSEHGETDTENQTSRLEKEHKSRRKRGGTISLKVECSPGKKLNFRREKVVELQPEDSTPRRLKFRRRVLDDRKTLGKKEANTAELFPFSVKQNLRRTQKRIYAKSSQKRIYAKSSQKRIYARRTKNKNYDTQSLPSWPPSPKEKGLLGTQFGTCVARSYTSSVASWSARSDASSEHVETDIENEMSDLERELKNRCQTGGIISSKDECTAGQKLTFQSGKVVDLQSEGSTTRRLKFRQRVLADNQNGASDSSMQSLGEHEADDGDDSATKTESEKVVLRHQDVSKKDSRNLFNNVIEKTLTELVKTRKSKVKALVGAFETVISLQDT